MSNAVVELSELLREQATRIGELNALLEQEQTALVQRDMETLQHLLSRKVELLGAVEADERRRLALLEAAGDSDGTGSMDTYFSAVPEPEAAREQWEHLRQSLQRCKALNEANGRVIRQQQTGVNRTMDLLQGESTTAASGYGPAPSSGNPGTGGREISRA